MIKTVLNKIDWLWVLVWLQAVSTLSIVKGWSTSEVFTVAHEDYIFIALLCTAFIRDAILKGKES